MLLLTDILLLVLGVGLLIPAGVLLLECVAALAPGRSCERGSATPRPLVAVLVPAHDEEAGIGATIASVLPQLSQGDRLVVVADNCGDGTAAAALSAGADVVERRDTDRRGKGYALMHGIEYLRKCPPDVLVILDADTHVAPEAVASLARAVQSTGRPAQALYVLGPPHNPTVRDLISCFAFTVKNLVRPLGLAAFGLPCPLTGSGIALPWAIAARASLAGGCIVEDMQLGVDLAIAGHPPGFCPEARVTGCLPRTRAGAMSQRTRWEHGHLEVLLKQTPRLLAEAARQRRMDLLGMALDLAVPPLSLLCLWWGVITGAALLAWSLGGSSKPAFMLGMSGGMLATSVFLAWGRFGRQIIPLRALLAVPFYVAWKIPLYLKFLVKRQKAWLRTEREVPPDATGREAQPGDETHTGN